MPESYDLLDDLVVDLAFNPHEPRDNRGRWTRMPGARMSTRDQEDMQQLLGLLGPGAMSSLREQPTAERIAELADEAKSRVNQYPQLLAQLPEGWKPVDDLTSLFPDDPQRTADWLRGLGPGLGAQGGSLVASDGKAILQVDLPAEIEDWSTKDPALDPALSEALGYVPAGIQRMAIGAAWATKVSSKAPGTGKSPVVVMIPEPGKWEMDMADMGGDDSGTTMAYTRLDAPDFITVNPYLILQPGQNNDPDLQQGWLAPSGADSPNPEGYTILHEFGHVNDARMGDTTGRPLYPGSPEDAVPTANSLYRKHKAAADKYGASMVFEMYAEAFAQFYGGGDPKADEDKAVRLRKYPEKVFRGMVDAATDYAKVYGWTK